jgi:hypothetical protein
MATMLGLVIHSENNLALKSPVVVLNAMLTTFHILFPSD